MSETAQHLSQKSGQGVRGTQSIQRAVSILYAIARQQDKGMRLHEIAEALELNASTVHRILASLIETDMLFFDKKTKSYFIGTGLYLMGAGSSHSVMKEQYGPLLRSLAGTFGDSTYLYVRANNEYICMDRVEGSFEVQLFTCRVGDSRPLGYGVGGITMLSFMPHDERAAILEINRPRLFNHAGSVYSKVLECIAISQSRGYGVGRNLTCDNTTGVGVPIWDSNNTVRGAICVSSISERMTPEKQQAIVAHIRGALGDSTPL